ncbi:hypothetical protein BYT27DRAFT_6644065 [Phlegmacium glaucopus]|nr:hypothetical protein BYT27DRAFT_6644065 [Phlegmacium glaucopus]
MTRWIHYPRFGLQSKQPPCLKTWGYLKWHLAPHFSICPSDVRAAIIEDLKAFQQDFSENKAKRQNKANYQIHFDALHCAMTVLVHLMFNKWHYREGLCHRSHNASQDCTVIDILDECPQALEDVKYATIYYQYRSILDDCYTSFTAHDGADINGLIHLIKSIPGFLVQRTMMPVKAVADLCSVDLEFAKDLLERNEQFVDRLDTYQRPSDVGPHLSGICLNRHMSQFLLDKSRSGPYHIRPSSHHVVICFHALSIFYDLNWSRLSNLDENVVTYLGNNFQQHLYGLDIRVEELVKKHPTSRFLDQLDNIIYYSPDMRDAPPANLAYIWHATNCILRWLQSQQVLDSDCGLQERLRRIADRIYAQILCVELRSIGSADGEENVGIITLCPPFLARVKDFIANVENTHSELEPIAFQKFDVDTVIPGKLEISDDFLLLPDIIPSLTEYLTDIKRAGRLYISPNTYHTQLAEYCLEMYPGQDWPSEQSDDDFCIMKRLEAERNWKFHLVRALPSERIFARLRVIRLSGPSMESFKDIIKWLEGLPEPPLDVYIRWQVEILKKDSEPLPVYPIWREEVTFRRQMDYYDYYVMWTEKLVEIKYGWILDFIFIGFFFRLCMYMFKFQL